MDTDNLWNFISIAPLALIVIVAIVIVFRGLGNDGDTTNNRAKGGSLGNWDQWTGGR
ncbi:hypothetical protein [Aliiroseovarius sp. YM-037]|uniref:hypothetical protein n=1 Tax=Aliiroseovarius sp. YM-037 TaxID=3341728 RepID=UPI003A7F680E